MLKKFEEFREKLTYKQLEKILWIVGIIIAIVYVAIFVLTEAWKIGYTWEDEMPFPMVVFLTWFFGEFAILMVIWLFLDGMTKSSIHNSKQAENRLSEKLKEDELTEVYFRPEIFGYAEKIFLDQDEMSGLKYAARKEGDKVIVFLMKEGEILRDYPIKNWQFFESNFKFPETEEKEE